jgi:hypothetical protein
MRLRSLPMKTIILAAALCVVACSKKSDDGGGGGTTSAGGGTCTDAAKGVDQMMSRAGGAASEADKASMAARGEQLKSIIVKHCSDDKWPADVIDCYTKAGSMPELKTCRSKLPPEQSQRLQAEIMQVMMAGGGGGPPH